jgi:uncharacterized protein (UPF0147 family)
MGNNLAIKLNDRQESFVKEILKGRVPADAYRAAGYSEESDHNANSLLHSPAIAAAIRFGITMRLTTEALPLAYNVLAELARDVAVPAAVRRAAARDLMDRAGFVAPKAIDAASAGADKPLSEMSSDELRGLVDKLESELGARALPVNAQPMAATKAKPLQWLD